jgi:hypothetical protein
MVMNYADSAQILCVYGLDPAIRAVGRRMTENEGGIIELSEYSIFSHRVKGGQALFVKKFIYRVRQEVRQSASILLIARIRYDPKADQSPYAAYFN